MTRGLVRSTIMQGLRDEVFRDPATSLTDDQVALRRQVLAQVEGEPETFSMWSWDTSVFDAALMFPEEMRDGCGTTRCIAGWTCYFAGCPVTATDWPADIELRAIPALGLTRLEWRGAAEGQLAFRSNVRDLFRTSAQDAIERLRAMTPQEA